MDVAPPVVGHVKGSLKTQMSRPGVPMALSDGPVPAPDLHAAHGM